MKNILYPLLAIILLASCTSQRYIYNPVPFYNPIFTDKNQSDLSASVTQGPSDGTYKASGKNIGIHLNGAYALTSHLAVTASYTSVSELDQYLEEYTINGNSSNDSAVVRYRRNVKQFGLGYSRPFHNNRHSFTLFGAIGMGQNKINERGIKSNNYYTNFHRSNSCLISLQPAINFDFSKPFGVSLLYRLTYVHNGNITTDYSDDQLSAGGLNKIENLFYQAIGCNLTILPKPYPWMKIKVQTLFSSTGETTDAIHYARGFTAAGGISLAMDKLLKKREK